MLALAQATAAALCWIAFVFAGSRANAQATTPSLRESLASAKRIVFLGDSITYQGDYVVSVEKHLRAAKLSPEPPLVVNMGLSSETVSGLSEDGHAGGRFPRPDLMERLDRVLNTAKPDFVFACYGMNCGIYQELSTERFQAYRRGIAELRSKLSKRQIPLVLITPVAFDGRVAKSQGKTHWRYDETLSSYSESLVSLRDQGQWVIDLHSCFVQQRNDRRRDNPDFTFQKDAVHPNQEGHQVMANCVIVWLRENGVDVESDPHSGAAASQASARQWNPTLLLTQKMHLLRDAYLTAAGHRRPGVKTGLPIAEATRRAKLIEDQLIEVQLSAPSLKPEMKP